MWYWYPQAFDLRPVKIKKSIGGKKIPFDQLPGILTCITFLLHIFFFHLSSWKSQVTIQIHPWLNILRDWKLHATPKKVLPLKYYFTPPLFQYMCGRNNISNLTLLLIDLQFHKKERWIDSPRWTFWSFRVFSWCFSRGWKITVNHDPFVLLMTSTPSSDLTVWHF